MQQLTIPRALRLSVVVLVAAVSSVAAAQGRRDAPNPTAAAPQSLASVAPDTRTLNPVDAKLHAQLRAALDARAQGLAWATLSGLSSTLRRGDEVLVEVRFVAAQKQDDAQDVLVRHGATTRNTLSPALHEVWMPIDRLRELAGEASVVQIAPARLVRHLAATSQGVAAGNADYWQKFNPSYTGTGITIAMIDGYDRSRISALQGSGDWPPTARLTCYDVNVVSSCTAGSFGGNGVAHGNATMEIVYDVAPGATYRAYDAVTVGDWRTSILDAANVNSSGGTLGAVKANVISASLAAPLDGIGDGSAQTGSIAEAAGFAQARGVLVVNAAGNERQKHWGGAYQLAPGSSSGFHTWDGSSAHQFNYFVDGNGNPACIPSGTEVDVDMYWNNWVATSHDFDLYLYQASTVSGSTITWPSLQLTQSNNPQNGGTGQTPQESIQYTTMSGATTTGCSSGAVYGIAVVRVVGTTTNDNLQVFANTALNYQVAASSLDFPADSPYVLSVAAIDVANVTNTPQEPFSSEGPVLATGGGIPSTVPSSDPNLKPDLASFDHVTTATYGTSAFYGTSVAASHAAGMAALFMQRFGVQTSATNLKNAIVTPLRTIAGTGTNDLGTSGKDYQYGYGRLRFQKDTMLAFVQQPTSALVNTAIAPAIKVGIYDGEGNLDLYTLFDTLSLAIANDPNAGTAVLGGGGNATPTAGVATYSAAKINLGGNGYTLKATASAATTPPIALTVTSNAFNITTGAAKKLAFLVQPSTEIAGHAISPTVKVAVEDSNGNVVNSGTNYQISLVRSTCSGAVPVGGGPLATTNAVAAFPDLTMYTAASSVTLMATASGLTAATSSPFTVSANPDYIFRGSFETCIP